jgi:hypothetical protein
VFWCGAQQRDQLLDSPARARPMICSHFGIQV